MTKRDLEIADAVRAAFMAYPACEQLTKAGRIEMARTVAAKLAHSRGVRFDRREFAKACLANL